MLLFTAWDEYGKKKKKDQKYQPQGRKALLNQVRF